VNVQKVIYKTFNSLLYEHNYFNLLAYDGDFCENDADGCEETACFNDGECIDAQAPDTGGICPPCPGGYLGDGQDCTDIDECMNSTICSQVCINTVGSFECGCHPGYELANDKITCNDINECDRYLANCAQLCTNTEGSYNCLCQHGLISINNGTTCQVDPNKVCPNDNMCQQICMLSDDNSTQECSCWRGYTLDGNNRTCSDINECIGAVMCSQLCLNINGSYACHCSSGYTLSDDGYTCIDDNECLEAAIDDDELCIEVEYCHNLPGSFECVLLEGLNNTSIITGSITSTTAVIGPSVTPVDVLSIEAIGGIVGGSIGGILIIGLVSIIIITCCFCCKKKNKAKQYEFAGSVIRESYILENDYSPSRQMNDGAVTSVKSSYIMYQYASDSILYKQESQEFEVNI
jgi:hypothetical protein